MTSFLNACYCRHMPYEQFFIRCYKQDEMDMQLI
jgi:hypothetical protein